MNKIIVKNQEELDLIPLDFDGQIEIGFGDAFQPAIIKHKYLNEIIIDNFYSCITFEDINILAYGKSLVFAHGNSTIEAFDHSYIKASNGSKIYAYDYSIVEARKSSHIKAWNNSFIRAFDDSIIAAYDEVSILIYGKPIIKTHDNCLCKVDFSVKNDLRPKTVNEFRGVVEFLNFHKARCKNGKVTMYMTSDIFDVQEFRKLISKKTEYKGYISVSTSQEQLMRINYASYEEDPIIFEIEANINDVYFVPDSNDHVPITKFKILREVPLTEFQIQKNSIGVKNENV